MIIRSLESKFLYEESLRLSASSYNMEYLTVLDQLDKCRLRLKNLAFFADAFFPILFKRTYVERSSSSTPFLSTSDMMQHEPVDLKFIPNATPNIEEYTVKSGWILVSRSGTVGNIAIVTKDMDGIAVSEHAIRVVPKDIRYRGFLYAYLASVYGQQQLKSKISGSVLDSIYEDDVLNIVIPDIPSYLVNRFDNLVEQINSKRVKANSLLKGARDIANKELGIEDSAFSYCLSSYCIDHVPSVELIDQLDAFYYVGYVGEAKKLLAQYRGTKSTLVEEGFKIWRPQIYKVNLAKNGAPFFTGVDLYKSHPKAEKKALIKSGPNEGRNLKIESDTMLIQGDGQRYGLIARPLLVTPYLDGVYVGNHLIRISHKDIKELAYLYALLDTEFGRRLLLGLTHGTMIPSLDGTKVATMTIPWLPKNIREKIADMVLEAYKLRNESYFLEDKMEKELCENLDKPLKQDG